MCVQWKVYVFFRPRVMPTTREGIAQSYVFSFGLLLLDLATGSFGYTG